MNLRLTGCDTNINTWRKELSQKLLNWISRRERSGKLYNELIRSRKWRTRWRDGCKWKMCIKSVRSRISLVALKDSGVQIAKWSGNLSASSLNYRVHQLLNCKIEALWMNNDPPARSGRTLCCSIDSFVKFIIKLMENPLDYIFMCFERERSGLVSVWETEKWI